LFVFVLFGRKGGAVRKRGEEEDVGVSFLFGGGCGSVGGVVAS
jgi:hypothetical protein